MLTPLWVTCSVTYHGRGQTAAAIANAVFAMFAPIFVGYWHRRFKRERLLERQRYGCCVRCGYDCRAMPSRSSECGAEQPHLDCGPGDSVLAAQIEVTPSVRPIE